MAKVVYPGYGVDEHLWHQGSYHPSLGILIKPEEEFELPDDKAKAFIESGLCRTPGDPHPRDASDRRDAFKAKVAENQARKEAELRGEEYTVPAPPEPVRRSRRAIESTPEKASE